MKKFIVLVLTAVMLFSISICAFAVGEGNIDNGGGGMGSGTSTNKHFDGQKYDTQHKQSNAPWVHVGKQLGKAGIGKTVCQ